MLDAIDKAIISEFQGGFPVCDRPYLEAAKVIGIAEDDLIARLNRLLENGTLSRFGPMYNAERMGGAFCLCAMSVDEENMDTIVSKINALPEVAHNYERQHLLNVWFVLATEEPEQIDTTISKIETATGLHVYAFPKLEEFFIGLRVNP